MQDCAEVLGNITFVHAHPHNNSSSKNHAHEIQNGIIAHTINETSVFFYQHHNCFRGKKINAAGYMTLHPSPFFGFDSLAPFDLLLPMDLLLPVDLKLDAFPYSGLTLLTAAAYSSSMSLSSAAPTSTYAIKNVDKRRASHVRQHGITFLHLTLG